MPLETPGLYSGDLGMPGALDSLTVQGQAIRAMLPPSFHSCVTLGCHLCPAQEDKCLATSLRRHQSKATKDWMGGVMYHMGLLMSGSLDFVN